VSYYNPYWAKAIQNQQKAQAKSQGKPQQQQQPRTTVREGFDDEWLDKDVEVEQVKGMIRGKVVGVSKYWLKITTDGQTLYVNKAYVVSIKPLEMKSGAPGGNDGRESPRSR